MTDKEMALGLETAEQSGDTDAIVEFENYICERLSLPLAWTEQGLNLQAAEAIHNFCAEHGANVAAAVVFDV